MAGYKELIKKVDEAFAENKKLKFIASDIENLSSEQIEGIYEAIKQHNLAYIEKARKDGLIDSEGADYLVNIYANARENRRTLYKNITDTLLQKYRPEKLRRLEELGEEPAPEEINAIDLDTGVVEQNLDQSSPHSSKYKEYRPQHITPFTDMRLTFYDFRDNPVYVIMPGIKDVRRAIDKIKIPVADKQNGNVVGFGGKYYQQYEKELNTLRRKYADNEEMFLKKAVLVKKPHERLSDVERFTITRKYYMDTEEILDIFSSDLRYGIRKDEIKDAFNANRDDGSKYNQKNYRDKKMYLHLKGEHGAFVVEGQVKITKLYEGDIHTHGIYAGDDADEPFNDNCSLISAENTKGKGLRFWEEGLTRFLNKGDRLIAKMNIFHKKMAIQKLNKEAIRAYNLQVIDKAFRLQDAKLANGKDYDAACLNPKSGKVERIFSGVAEFITKNFIYRPFKAYDMEKAFNVTTEELCAQGLLISAQHMKSFTERYSRFIMPKYRGKISGHEAARFNLPENQEILSDLFKERAYNEQRIDETSPSRDELEVLSNFDKKKLLRDKKNKLIYKKLDKKRKNYHNNRKDAAGKSAAQALRPNISTR